jgi:uridine kinase
MDQGTRDEVLGRLAEAVGSVTVGHPTRVAVDGPPAAGKTTLADELAVVLRTQGREVIRATIDDFLFPRAQRYPRGEYSAEGCYFDTHDHDALNRVLLDPLGPGGDRRCQYAVYDRTADTALCPPVTTAPVNAVLVFDGVFLMRPELIDRWELRISTSLGSDRPTTSTSSSTTTSPAADLGEPNTLTHSSGRSVACRRPSLPDARVARRYGRPAGPSRTGCAAAGRRAWRARADWSAV